MHYFHQKSNHLNDFFCFLWADCLTQRTGQLCYSIIWNINLIEFIQKQAISSPACCQLHNSLETYLLARLLLTVSYQTCCFSTFLSQRQYSHRACLLIDGKVAWGIHPQTPLFVGVESCGPSSCRELGPLTQPA